jgi:hypothetical protein
MNLNELIEKLTDLRDDNEEAGEMEVRFASQPSHPFEYDIDDEVVVVDELGKDEQSIIYLAEGKQVGYLPGAVSKALGWR